MFSNRRATSGGVLVPHVVPMVSGSKRGSHTVPSGLPWSSYMDKALSVTPLRRSGEGIESFYCDIRGVLPVTTACPLDGDKEFNALTASLYLPPSMYVWMYPRATVPPGRCSEQPAPAPGCQGMSCGLLGGRFAIRSAPGPLAALV